MTITSAIVLFAVIWALVFFLVLPFGQVSQHEAGDVVPGTPASAPENAQIARKAALTTAITVVAFAAVLGIIYFDLFSIHDIPFLTPPATY